MRLRLAILVLAAVAAYANGLTTPLVIDDHLTIRENPQIRNLWSLDVLQPERELPVAGRPLANLTFAVNYALHGESVAGYHLVNLLLHIACGILLFLWLRRVLLLPRVRARIPDGADNIAFATALLWLVHPLNSEVVNYLTQRTESLMALFLLLTLYASLRALDERGRTWTTTAVVACALGMLCKESMVVAPVLVVLFDRVFVFDSWHEASRRRGSLYVGLVASWAVLAVMMWSGPRIRSAGFDAGVGVWTYLLNQTVMITRYLQLTFWPHALVVYYGWPPMVTLADVLPYALLVTGLAVATIVGFRYSPMLAFAGAWFFITLAPTSSLVPIATEVGAERRMYLPLMAITVAVMVLLARRRLLHPALIAVLAVSLGATTFARNREYASELTLAETTLDRWPTGMAHLLVGEQLVRAGRADEAMPHLREAIKDAPRAHYSLGMQLLNIGQLDEGIEELQTFIRLQPLLLEVPDAHVALARAYARQMRWIEVEAEARQAIAKAPRNASARGLFAEALFKQEKVADAIQAYANYLQLQPSDTGAMSNLGILFASSGRMPEAVNAFRRAADMKPEDGELRRNLATALLDANALPQAEVEARRTIELRPGDPVGYDLLGQVLARQGRLDLSLAQFERAVQIDPMFEEGRAHLEQVRGLLRR